VNPAQPVQVAVVGIGIRGLGLAGSAGFLERLFHRPGRIEAGPVVHEREVDPDLLAPAAADEAHGTGGTWTRAGSGIFLGLAAGPGQLLLGRELQQRYGFLGRGRVCRGGALAGNQALDAAVRRIQSGSLESALVGALEFWPLGAGLALFLALRRRDRAERNGDAIWAVLAAGPERVTRMLPIDSAGLLPGPSRTVGGLLQLAAGCAMAAHHACFSPEDGYCQPILDRADGVGFAFETEMPGGAPLRTDLWRAFQPGPPPRPLLKAPAIYPYAGADLADLLQRLERDERGGTGPVRLALVAQDERERQRILGRVPLLLEREEVGPGWVDSGACFSPAPLRGRVACLFSAEGNGYLGMGRQLLLGMPFLPMLMRGFRDLTLADWIYGGHRGRASDPLFDSAGTLFLSQLHAAFTRDVLGIRPDLAMGLSQGERHALIAYGAWNARDGEFEQVPGGGSRARLLAGMAEGARRIWGLPGSTEVQWRNWTVFGPVAKVLEQVASEPRAYVSIIYSSVHCLLAGEAQACRRVLAGCPGLTAFLAVSSVEHTPVMTQVRATYARQCHRPTRPVPGIEFHSHHFGGGYPLSDEQVAVALTGQSLEPLDFPAAAWKVWNSGVRIFIEHGPRNLLSAALARTLPKGEGLFLALDVQGENPLQRAVKVAAELWARGVAVDLECLRTLVDQDSPARAPVNPLLDVAASLFAASLACTGSLDGAYQACLRETQGRFLEFLGQAPE